MFFAYFAFKHIVGLLLVIGAKTRLKRMQYEVVLDEITNIKENFYVWQRPPNVL